MTGEATGDDHLPTVQHFHGSGAVLIRGDALPTLFYLARLGAGNLRRDGGSPTRYHHLLSVLAAAAAEVRPVSACPREDVPGRGPSARSDEIGTAEAAALLGLSDRQIRRLAPSLGARRTAGRALVLDRGAVERYRLERQAGETE